MGLCPKTPVAGCAGYGLIFDGSPKSIRTAHRIAPKVATGVSALTALRCPKKSSHYSIARFFRPLRILRLASSATGGARLRIPPPPFPMAGKGPGWAEKIKAAAWCSGHVRTCGGGGSRWLGCGTMIGRKMSRWPMVMVSGAIGLQEKGGRSPPPKRGRLGGGRCAAAPYKHRLAHDPGRRSRSGRAFRCVGVLGFTPSRFWNRGPRRVVRPGGERRAHRSGEGCP